MVPFKAIQDYADAIARQFKPERIILFGSYANGTATEDSDVDLLVVMEDSGDPIEMTLAITRTIERPQFPLDLIVRDPAVLQWRMDLHDWFLIEILEKGRVLHESVNA